jgi:hypothetical protein
LEVDADEGHEVFHAADTGLFFFENFIPKAHLISNFD